MYAQKLVIDQSRNGEVVEKIHDEVVYLLVVLGQAFIRKREYTLRGS